MKHPAAMLRLLALFVAACPVAAIAAVGTIPAPAAAPINDLSFKDAIREIRSSNDFAAGLAKLEVIARRSNLSLQEKLIVAGMRISALNALKRGSEGRAIARQIVAEYPQRAEAHLLMAGAAFGEGDFAATAQSTRRASEIDPASVNRIGVYELRVVFNWLESQEKVEESTALAQRLFDSGWDKGGPRMRSGLALDVIEQHLAKDDQASASRYVPMIADAGTFATILSEKRFAAIRPAAVDWAGERLQKQWPIYLEQTRTAWLRTGGPEAAADYAGALDAAGHHRTLIETFLPQFDKTMDATKDDLWVFLVGPLARSLAYTGRWDEAFALYDRASKIWPPSFGANALNIDANRARTRMLKGDFATSLPLYAALSEQVAANVSEVTPQTRATIRADELCARHRAGKGDVSQAARALAAEWTTREPYSIAWLQLCLGKKSDAIETWRAAVANPKVQSDAVSFIQLRPKTVADSDFAREMRAAETDLANDPELRAIVAPYGDRLGFTLADAAPKEAPAQSR